MFRIRPGRLGVAVLLALIGVVVPLARPADAASFTCPSGTASAGGGAKICNIAVNSGDFITATLTWSGNANLQLSLKNPANAAVANGFSTPPVGPEKVVYKAPSAGTYHLIVTSKTGSSAYQLSGTTDPTQPSNLTNQRTATVNKAATATHTHDFSVPVQPGTIDVTLNWPTTTANLNLSLKDPTGAVKASSNTTNRSEHLTFTATKIGTWHAVVTAATGSSSYTLDANVNYGPVPNRAPVAVNDSATTTVDVPTTVNVLANDTDADGDALHVTGATDPAHGTTVVNPDNTITYTPDALYTGPDTFDYTVCDDDAVSLCDTGTVNITVRGANLAPVANADTATATTNVNKIIAPLANDTDPDSDPLHLGTVDDPDHGTATKNGDNTVTYRSDAGFTGVDTFGYQACDNSNACTSSTIAVTVSAATGSPTEYSGYYYWEGGSLTSSMSQQVADPLIDGMSVVKKWEDIETAPGTFNWSIYDSWFNRARELNKPLIVRSFVGINADTPQWLYTAHNGDPAVTKWVNGAKTLPHFWHPTFQKDLRDFVNALGARYGSYDKFAIEVFGPWDPFAEPILPCLSSTEQNIWVADYKAFSGNNAATFATVQQAYEDFHINFLLQTFHNAFPTRPLLHATGRLMCENQTSHPTLKKAFDFARTNYGGFSNGINGQSGFFPQNNGFKIPPYPIAVWISQLYNPVNGTSSHGGIGYQPIGCVSGFCTDGQVMSADTFVQLLDKACELHASYMEIHGETMWAAAHPENFTGQKQTDAQKIRTALQNHRSCLESTMGV
jgi:hypothetical protein